jgi:hypothetical protein
MKNLKNRIKRKVLMLPLALIVGGMLMFNPSTIFVEKAEATTVQSDAPECEYGTENHWLFGCRGETTQLCKGSADCPVQLPGEN